MTFSDVEFQIVGYPLSPLSLPPPPISFLLRTIFPLDVSCDDPLETLLKLLSEVLM